MNKSASAQTREGNIVVGLLIGAVIALIPSYYFYTKYQEVNKKLKKSSSCCS
jgi:Na+-translocating ferredoxin:NAD+ oxidoreductase RnfD subunit